MGAIRITEKHFAINCDNKGIIGDCNCKFKKLVEGEGKR